VLIERTLIVACLKFRRRTWGTLQRTLVANTEEGLARLDSLW